MIPMLTFRMDSGDFTVASCKAVSCKRGKNDFQNDGFHNEDDGVFKAQPEVAVFEYVDIILEIPRCRQR